MNAAAGIVRSQAQTIRRATPHRTADSRRVAPTPMIAPVIVWVVLIPHPQIRGDANRERRPGFGREAAHRLQACDL